MTTRHPDVDRAARRVKRVQQRLRRVLVSDRAALITAAHRPRWTYSRRGLRRTGDGWRRSAHGAAARQGQARCTQRLTFADRDPASLTLISRRSSTCQAN